MDQQSAIAEHAPRVVESLCKHLNSPEAIVLISVGVLSLGVFALTRFWLYEMRPLRLELERATAKLTALDDAHAFVDAFDEFDEWAESSAFLSHPWREFVETLILPEPDCDPANRTIRNATQADQVFTTFSMIHDRVNIRLYTSISNLLLGLGVLGTFLGLSAGIYLAKGRLTDTTTAIEALNNLLGGASLAFTTSLVGLLSSLAYSFFEKRILYRTEVRLSSFNQQIERLLDRITPEKLAAQTLEQAERQTARLERFSSDLAVQLAEAIDEKMVLNVVPELRDIVHGLEDLAKVHDDRLVQAMEKLVNEFRRQVGGAFEDQLEGLAETLRKTSEMLERTLRESSQEVAKGTEQSIAQITVAGTELSAALRESSTTAAERILYAGTEAGKSIESGAQLFTKSQQALRETLRVAEDTLERGESVATALGESADRVATAASDTASLVKDVGPVASQLESAARSCRQVSEGLAGLSNQIGAATEVLLQGVREATESWETQADRFASTDEKLGSVFGQIEAGLIGYTTSIEEFWSKNDQHLGNALNHIAGAVEELREVAEDLHGNGKIGGAN